MSYCSKSFGFRSSFSIVINLCKQYSTLVLIILTHVIVSNTSKKKN